MFKKLGTLGINGLMAVLLLGMLVLPITSFGLTSVKTKPFGSEVLSAQDTVEKECTCPSIVITPGMEREIYERLLKEEQEAEALNIQE